MWSDVYIFVIFFPRNKFINEKKKIIMKRELLETTDFGHMVIDSQKKNKRIKYMSTDQNFSRGPCDHCCSCLVSQLCPTLCNPMDCRPPGSSVRGGFPGKSTGVGCHFLLQGIFLTQGLNPGLLHCRWILLPSEAPGKHLWSLISDLCFRGIYFKLMAVEHGGAWYMVHTWWSMWSMVQLTAYCIYPHLSIMSV